jgi:hypothetical protein
MFNYCGVGTFRIITDCAELKLKIFLLTGLLS